MANLEIRKVGNIFYPSIIFHNNSDDTIGIYASGRIRTNYQDTTKLIDRVLYDIILQIKQNGKFIKSTDIGFDWTRLDNRTPQLYILFPDSTMNLLIAYSYDLRKDFKIRDAKFEIRAILDPPIEFL